MSISRFLAKFAGDEIAAGPAVATAKLATVATDREKRSRCSHCSRSNGPDGWHRTPGGYWEEIRKLEAGGNGGLAENRMNAGFPVAESWRKVAENSGQKHPGDQIRQNPPAGGGKEMAQNQSLIEESANPPNPPAPESRETGPKVVPMTPDAPEPVGEAAIRRAMERAVIGFPITPQEFRSCLDGDEAAWCATGRIPIKTARAYARLFARELAQAPDHPSNKGMVTCWGCQRFRNGRCISGREPTPEEWIQCSEYMEVRHDGVS